MRMLTTMVKTHKRKQRKTEKGMTVLSYLSRITWILSIYKVEGREKTNIHGSIDAMPQLIHVFLAKIL